MKILKQLQAKRTDIVAHRGAAFNQKECPMVHWIKGKLYAKNQGPDSRDEKTICLLG